uniref:Tubby C-terminal domain-containing protein n=1 Tax=Heliothis virescens TaxID=7102 RepID=A0A2A4IXU2_HELVI
MTGSCSVGYLDLVDPQVLHAQTECTKTPSLRRCGKSRSLDSSEMSLTVDKSKRLSRIEHGDAEGGRDVGAVEQPLQQPGGEDNSGNQHVGQRAALAGDYPVCTACRLVALRHAAGRRAALRVRGLQQPRARAAARRAAPAPPIADSDYSKYYSSLGAAGAAPAGVARGGGRAAGAVGGDGKRCGRGRAAAAAAARECSSAPASPRAGRSHPAGSAPAESAPRTPPRRHRYSSASPIRQLLNSPLLNRRRNKKPSESSDDEYSTGGGYSEVNGRNYRDLESFQKAQLRNKLKRAGGVMPASGAGDSRSSTARRQLVMHNKAPMWNENSQVYQLDFGGRVTQESAKNFQIEYHGKQVMQFGRIDGNAYTLDFQYPFSALQAFAVALANVTQRLK